MTWNLPKSQRWSKKGWLFRKLHNLFLSKKGKRTDWEFNKRWERHITRYMCFPGRKHVASDTCSQVGKHISLLICVDEVGEQISLGISVSLVEEHKSLGICVSQGREHLLPPICIPGYRNTYRKKPISLVICVSQVGELISLKVSVKRVGEHISQGLYVSLPEKHITYH